MKILITTLLLVSVFSCSKEDMTLEKTGKSQLSGDSSYSQDEIMKTAMDAMTPHFFAASYKIKVKSGFMTVCEAILNLEVSSRLGMDGNPPFVMDLPPLDCMFGIKVDITQIFAGLAADVKGKLAGQDLSGLKGKALILQKLLGLDADKNAIYLNHIYAPPVVDVEYSPKRALLPNVIAGDPEVLSSFDITQEFTAKDMKTGEMATGYTHMKMESWAVPHEAPSDMLREIAFNDTSTFVAKSRGFEGVNTLRTFIPNELRVVLSRDPVAVLEIFVKMKILDALALGQTRADAERLLREAQASGGLLTNIAAMIMESDSEVFITLQEQEGIDELAQQGQRETTDNIE